MTLGKPTDDDFKQIAGVILLFSRHGLNPTVAQYTRDVECFYDPESPAHWSNIDLYAEHEITGDAKAFAMLAYVAVNEWMKRRGGTPSRPGAPSASQSTGP